MSEIEQRLEELERLGLHRRLRMVSGPQGPRVLLDGKPVLLLCSNNYLGLADHPRVREAAADAAMRWGVGAGASRLVSGTMTIHRRLEERLAAWEGSEACLLFGSGYLANLGTIGALAGPGDTVFSDELNHASIVDGCRLSRAEVVVYQPRDMDDLDRLLRRHGRTAKAATARLIVTDSVFSMDGDVAPLAEIVELAKEYGARTMVDEAHATGALGPGGRGAVAQAGLEGEVDVVVGTLGKALGSYGAYVCAERGDDPLPDQHRPLADLLDRARTAGRGRSAGSAGVAAGAPAPRAAAALGRAHPARAPLRTEGFPVVDGEMQIVPLIVGDGPRRCACARRRSSAACSPRRSARRPCAAGTSRLRLAVMASHTAEELKMAARVLGEAARAIGLDPAAMGPRVIANRARIDERED